MYPRLMDADLVLPFHDYRLLERYADGISASGRTRWAWNTVLSMRVGG